jgi:hypothetical protein
MYQKKCVAVYVCLSHFTDCEGSSSRVHRETGDFFAGLTHARIFCCQKNFNARTPKFSAPTMTLAVGDLLHSQKETSVYDTLSSCPYWLLVHVCTLFGWIWASTGRVEDNLLWVPKTPLPSELRFLVDVQRAVVASIACAITFIALLVHIETGGCINDTEIGPSCHTILLFIDEWISVRSQGSFASTTLKWIYLPCLVPDDGTMNAPIFLDYCFPADMSLLLVARSRTQLEPSGSICEMLLESSLRGDCMARKEDLLPILLLERVIQVILNKSDSKQE